MTSNFNILRNSLNLVLIFLLIGCATIQPDRTSVLEKGDVRSPVITVPYIFNSKYAGKWNSVIYTLDHTNANVVTLYWAGRGGYVYIGERVMDAINRAEARGVRVIIQLNGYSASMHALAPCAANYVKRSGTMMFHLRGYKGLVDRSYGSRAEFARLASGCVALGILTSADIATVQSGKELHVLPNNSKRILPDKRLEY